MSLKQLWPGWETVRVIGSGGFGKVYEIRKTDDTGEYPSALKVISIPRSEDEYNAYIDDGYDEKSITSIFKNKIDEMASEFRLMAQFKGVSNIVSYEEHMIVPHEDGHGWDILIRMELLTSLPEYYNQHSMTEAEVVRLGIDICHALELCGKKNIIHRDIKPRNIFVNAFGDFKLGDFGIAKTMEHTTRASRAGTYNYMSPEVFRGKPYNATADIYSLGLVLYWLLNERRLPFQPLPPDVPTADQNEEAQNRRMNGEALDFPKNCSEELGRVVLKACAPNPKNRYQSAREMRAALSNIRFAAESTKRVEAGNDSITGRETEWDFGKPVSKTNKKQCENCGVVITEKTAVCPNCKEPTGITVGPFETICEKCGCVTPAHLDQCVFCGASLIEEKTETQKIHSTANSTSKAKRPRQTVGEDLTCPWCNGKGHKNVIRYYGKASKRKYWVSDETCGFCDGTGLLFEEDAPSILREFSDIKKTREYKNANPNCSCCGGIGYIDFEGEDCELKPCPVCAGEKVHIYTEQQIKSKYNREIERRIHLLSFNMFIWVVASIFISNRFSISSSLMMVFLAIDILPMLFALQSTWKNPLSDHKSVLRTWTVSAIIAIVCAALFDYAFLEIIWDAGTTNWISQTTDTQILSSTSSHETNNASATIPYVFSDPAVESAVRQQLGSGTITADDLEMITELHFYLSNIENLDDLSKIVNLTSLTIESCGISDISVLSSLVNLTELHLNGNSISDISALARLTKLSMLDLSRNQIRNLSPLSGLVNLNTLDLQDNQISDIGVLSGLVNLVELNLTDNQIRDISPLATLSKLNHLSLGYNQISDIEALSGIPYLKILFLHNNTITDINSLSNMITLTVLTLGGNPIGDISVISDLVNLTSLNLEGCGISDVSVLSKLVNLTSLDLDSNNLKDIHALSGLVNLTCLELNDNQISDVSVLSGLVNLTSLSLAGNPINDYAPLDNLIHLEYLNWKRIQTDSTTA